MPNKTYVGIADAHGIETILPKEKADFPYYLRAMFNRQRHAVYFEAELLEDNYNLIVHEARTNPQNALKFLKMLASKISMPKDQSKSWDLIPNPDLDPWS